MSLLNTDLANVPIGESTLHPRTVDSTDFSRVPSDPGFTAQAHIAPRKFSGTGWKTGNLIPWAAVASLSLILGLLGGRASSPGREEIQSTVRQACFDTEKRLASTREKEIREIVSVLGEENRKLLSQLISDFAQTRAAEQQTWLAALQESESQRMLEVSTLRIDLQRLARQTGTGFRLAESQLNLIAEQLPRETSDHDRDLDPRTSAHEP